MIFKKFYPPFNRRRHKFPKMAQLIGWPIGESEALEFKIKYYFAQNETGGGSLEANLLDGTIIRVWQKDLYANYQEPAEYFIFNKNGVEKIAREDARKKIREAVAEKRVPKNDLVSEKKEVKEKEFKLREIKEF